MNQKEVKEENVRRVTLNAEECLKVKEIIDTLNEYLVSQDATVIKAGVILSSIIAMEAEMLHSTYGLDKQHFVNFVADGARHSSVSIIRTKMKEN
ncbi:MAG: hypothetical protein PUF37_00850 [Prevotellaceae bacterium]|nr:hypothetical protein [Prevotellaceae bacterium]